MDPKFNQERSWEGGGWGWETTNKPKEDDLNGSWVKEHRFQQGCSGMPSKEMHCVLRPAEDEPCKDLGKQCCESQNRVCKGPEVRARRACDGAREGMEVGARLACQW